MVRWNHEVIIGEREQQICSAGRLTEIGDIYISQNREEYWISHVFLGSGRLVIQKSHPVGESLAALLNLPVHEARADITALLVSTYLANAPVEVILSMAESYGKNKFEEGQRDKARMMRNVLGLN